MPVYTIHAVRAEPLPTVTVVFDCYYEVATHYLCGHLGFVFLLVGFNYFH
jgi:hypothetical protein